MNSRDFIKLLELSKYFFQRIHSDDDILAPSRKINNFSDIESDDDSDSSVNSSDEDSCADLKEITLNDTFKNLITVTAKKASKKLKITYCDINHLEDLNKTEASEYCRVLYEFCSLMQSKNQLKEVVRKFIEIGFFNLYSESLKIHFNELIKTANEDLLATLSSLMDIVIKLSKASLDFCEEFTEAGLNEIYMSLLGNKFFSKDVICSDNKLMDVCFRLLSVVYNVVHVNKVQEASLRLIKMEASDICQKYRDSKSLKITYMARMIWVYLRSEKENDQVDSDSAVCKLALQILNASLKGEAYEGSNFSPEESMDSVIQIAHIDANKFELIKEGVLKYYVKILQNAYQVSERVIVMAVEGIWTLSFKCADEVRADPETIKALNRAVKHNNVYVCEKATEALSFLETKANMNKGAQSSQKRIFISYQHESKKMILKIRDSLESAGFKTWQDMEDIDTRKTYNEAIAIGIEEASFVLICFSEEYLKSYECRKEAEYADINHKRIIPLRMQPNFKPNDWLGLILGGHIYYDFSDEEKYETSLKELIKKLHSSNKESVIERPQSARSRAGVKLKRVMILKRPHEFSN